MTPDLSDHTQDIPTINALEDRIGPSILVTHSAGGFSGCKINPFVRMIRNRIVIFSQTLLIRRFSYVRHGQEKQIDEKRSKVHILFNFYL